MATRGPDVDSSAFQWRVAGSAAIVGAAGAAGTFLPSVNSSEFWSTSVSLFLLRVAVMMLMLGLAWFWSRASDPMVQLGRASLFVYWVHVELAYGFFSHPLHHALPLPAAVVAFGLLTLLMWWAAGLWLEWRGPWIPAFLVAGRPRAEVQSLQVLS
jgi:fucose 4-O-acetylase-like acetyltransferase